MRNRIFSFFRWLFQFNFGHFEEEELKKFFRMGLIFAVIIGVYWTLRPLKDAVFIQLVGKLYLPYAKTVSVFALLFFVMFYTKLIEKFSVRKMLVILSAFYGISILIFSGVMFFAQRSAENISMHSYSLQMMIKALGYLWYVFVESFGSLVVALFWAFSTSVTQPSSAKRGFPLVVAMGQLSGIILPYSIGGMPHRLGLTTDALSMACLGVLTLLIIPIYRYFVRRTPKDLLVSFQKENIKQEKKKQKVGFLEGLYLLLKNRYLLGIFAVNFIYEVIVTIFDFNFKLSASEKFSGVALSNYLSIFGSSVNIVAFFCLLFGISNVTRLLGVGTALACMPVILGLAFFGFLSLNNLSFLFALMVGSKAINYALNGPALKQLYIPTTADVRSKAQAWIETFGSRTSKQAGSVFNMSLAPLQASYGAVVGKSYYLTLSGFLCFPIIALWFVVAVFLGNSFKKAINKSEVIC